MSHRNAAWWLVPLTSLASVVCAAEPGAQVQVRPLPGRDYHSIQIASAPSARELDKMFTKYAGLPYLRIERRGDLHVLRAGFWASAEEARAASGSATPGRAPLLRIATYRPEAVVRGNWQLAEPVVEPVVAAGGASTPTPTSTRIPQPGASPAAELSPTVAPLQRPEGDDGKEGNRDSADRVVEDAQLRPFDAEDYALAYDVFLGSGDRERAFRVARKAVASVPGDLLWRRKLARVAEWTQRPALAWEQWESVFRRGDRSDETLAAVLRLAPLAANPDIALEAWEIRAARGGALSDAQWEDIHNLYENAAKAQQGSRFFEQQYRRNGKLRLLEYAAQLAENAGEDDRALQLYRERADLKPFSLDATLRTTVLLLRRDQLRDAYALMDAHRDEVAADAREYWNMLTNIALELAETKTAEIAMRRLDDSGTPQSASADWTRLIFQLRQQHPQRAADLALEVYRRYGDKEYLFNALDLYGERGDRAAQARVLVSLKPAALSELEGNTRFLLLRAQHYQQMLDDTRAWADFRRALALKPDDDEIIVPVMWFLIDNHRKEELQPLLRRFAVRAEATAAYWLPYAAAHHALDRYKDAIHWYGNEAARNPDDMLLLLNYADALDRVQMAGMAERMRRHAWLRLREKIPKPELAAPLDRNPELLALARLAILNAPGDPGLALVRKVVGELRGLSELPTYSDAKKESQSDQQTHDLILGWAISQEQHRNARAWLWLNHARSASARLPLWGEAQTALQLNETPRMDRLLLDHGEGLPIYNRYDTAYALEHWPQALDIAFKGMSDSDVDEELHDRYRQHAPRHANYVQVRVASDSYGALDSNARQYELHLVADRRLQLGLGWSQLSQSSDDANLATPPRERLASVEAQWLGSHGDSTLALFRRNELAGNTGWRFSQTWAWSSHLNLSGGLERRAEATESLPLRVGGNQDSLRFGLSYAIGKREYVSIVQRLTRYRTQYDDYLGSSRILDLEAGYRIRTEYPDWRARIFATTQSFSYNGTVGAQALARLAPDVQAAIAGGSVDAIRYFLPEGSTTVGACFGMGENLAGQNLQETYTRAWRHFYDICPNHNSLNGTGYSGVIGVAGSLSGEDHLSLRLEQTNGGSGAGAMSRMLAARYRHYF